MLKSAFPFYFEKLEDLIFCDPGFLMAIICRVHVPEAPLNFQFFTAPSSPGSQWPSASNFSCLANSYKHFMLRPWPKESMKIPQQSKTDEIQPSWVYSLFCSQKANIAAENHSFENWYYCWGYSFPSPQGPAMFYFLWKSLFHILDSLFPKYTLFLNSLFPHSSLYRENKVHGRTHSTYSPPAATLSYCTSHSCGILGKPLKIS